MFNLKAWKQLWTSSQASVSLSERKQKGAYNHKPSICFQIDEISHQNGLNIKKRLVVYVFFLSRILQLSLTNFFVLIINPYHVAILVSQCISRCVTKP